MRARLLVTTLLSVTAAMVETGASQMPQAGSTADVRLIASDSLRDVAFTATKDGRYVIYYNPILLQRVGPRLAAFFIAHEYGHVAAGHTGGAFLSHDSTFAAVRVRQELEADCRAAARLAGDDRAAVDAAIAFFARQGPTRYDRLHPSGSQRAANLAACLPAPQADIAVAEQTSRAAAFPAKTTGRAPFAIELTTRGAPTLRGAVRVRINGQPVGQVSNLGLPLPLAVTRFDAGTYSYELVIQLSAFDEQMQLVPGGTVVGSGTITVAPGDVFEVRWTPGEIPTLARVER